MRRLLLWLDDTNSPSRGKVVALVVAVLGGVVGAVIGVAVAGTARMGLIVGVLAACGFGVFFGVAAFISGARAAGDTAWQHLKRSWAFSSYGKEPMQ